MATATKRRKRRHKVKVTAEHIANNRKGQCEDCAVAQALHDSLGGRWHVMDHKAREAGPADAFRGGDVVRFQPRITRLIRALDRGDPIEPFEF